MKKLFLIIIAISVAGIASANQYTDAIGDEFTGISILDIVSVEVTRDATDIMFTINLAGDPSTTDWGKYLIAIDSVAGGDTVGNGWGRPISMSSGMDYWIGTWVDGGGGAETYSWDGAVWNLDNATYSPPSDVAVTSITSNSMTITTSLASLGLSISDTITFDVFTSEGSGSGGAIDALSDPNQTVAAWGDHYVSTSTLTLGFPQPPTEYLLDVTVVGGGSLNFADGWQPAGTNLALTATPDAGWLFMGWSGDLSGDFTQTNSVLLMDSDKNITATFSDDADEDGLINTQEESTGTDPRDSDTDDDGLIDGDEVNTYGTDPLNIDSDADGLPDGDEVNLYGTDPLNTSGDVDSDGLTDANEILYQGTDHTDPDSDDDGLSDGSEVSIHSTDPLDADTDDDSINDGAEVSNGLSPVISNVSLDSDSDGLLDAQEVNSIGTDPLDGDSDNDTLLDGDEVNTYGTNPVNQDTDNDLIRDDHELVNSLNPLLSNTGLDSDSDNLGDVAEVNTYGTNPLSNDTDADMLLDFAEIFTYGTDPTLADTDADGLTDHTEIFAALTSPFDPDTDDDGLSDGNEVNVEGTNPKDNDSDDDGLPDGEEVNTYLTNPLAFDTDGDGLTDGDEVNVYFTIPTDADTDNDGASDGDEVLIHGTDPNDNLSDADQDEDGIYDVWEREHFGVIQNCDPGDDSDGDLYTHLEEFRNDTDPNTWDFYLEQYTSIELVWKMSPGTNYQIQCSTSLTSNSWENVGGVYTGDGTTNAVFDSTRYADKNFYRVIVVP